MSESLKGLFIFTFGGLKDFGKVVDPNTEIKIDFPNDQSQGYVIAVRNGLEIKKFSSIKELNLDFISTTDLVLTFKVKVQPRYQVVKSVEFNLTEGVNHITYSDFNIDEHQILQMDFLISKEKNPEKVGSIQVRNFELC